MKKKNNIYCGCIALNHTILQYQEYDLSISVGQEINEQSSGDDDKYKIHVVFLEKSNRQVHKKFAIAFKISA